MLILTSEILVELQLLKTYKSFVCKNCIKLYLKALFNSRLCALKIMKIGCEMN